MKLAKIILQPTVKDANYQNKMFILTAHNFIEIKTTLDSDFAYFEKLI
jgi:hypothetical protein